MQLRAVTEGWSRRLLLVALATTGLAAGGCGGGDGGAASAPPASGANPPPSSSDGGSGGDDGPGQGETPPAQGGASLKISGSPATQAKVGSLYSFTPAAEAPDSEALAFSVQNRPEWATFNTVTGTLSGTPAAEGEFGDIVIVVSDGNAQATLPAFSITVAAADAPSGGTPPGEPVPPGAVTLQWSAPTQSVLGEALSDLAGYRIHYGKTETALTHSIDVPTVGMASFMVENLSPGTYYFAIRAYTSSGEESSLSNVQAVDIG